MQKSKDYLVLPFGLRTLALSQSRMTNAPFDLKARARQAMLEAGFQPDFPPEIGREVRTLTQRPLNQARLLARDLRSLLWSSIDNDTSRDLDQVECAEKLSDGAVRLLIGMGDVDCHDVYLALIRNAAKLVYHSTGAWLEGRGSMPPAIAAVAGMEDQLRLQLDTSER